MGKETQKHKHVSSAYTIYKGISVKQKPCRIWVVSKPTLKFIWKSRLWLPAQCGEGERVGRQSCLQRKHPREAQKPTRDTGGPWGWSSATEWSSSKQCESTCLQHCVNGCEGIHLRSSHSGGGAGGSKVQGHPWIRNKSEASLEYMKPYLKKDGREGREKACEQESDWQRTLTGQFL